MLPGGEPCNLRDLLHVLPGLDLYHTAPAQHVMPARVDLDELYVVLYLSDVCAMFPAGPSRGHEGGVFARTYLFLRAFFKE